MDQVHFSDSECENMFQTLGALLEELENIEDEDMKQKFTGLMQHFDVIHREALSRMWTYMKKHQPAMCEELNKDYAIKHLLSVYDLESFTGIDKALDKTNFISVEDLKIL